MPSGDMLTLFGNSLLAATVLPIGSEPLVIYLLNAGSPPLQILFWASLGNTLGAVVNYYLGAMGGKYLLERVWRVDPQKLNAARGQVQRYGAPMLLLSWMPVIGDPITIAAGMAKYNFYLFLLWVALAKTTRYAAVIWGVSSIL